MMFYDHLKGHIEALLFASGQAISSAKLADILQIPEEHVLSLLDKLQSDMLNKERGLTIAEVAGGFQLCTKPEFAEIIEKLVETHESNLSMAAMETLSIIAFKQPITRQEIEVIRGVRVDRVLNTLLERRLIKEIGRKEAIGRPILFGTTSEFLNCFGLKSLAELPAVSVAMPTSSER